MTFSVLEINVTNRLVPIHIVLLSLQDIEANVRQKEQTVLVSKDRWINAVLACSQGVLSGAKD